MSAVAKFPGACTERYERLSELRLNEKRMFAAVTAMQAAIRAKDIAEAASCWGEVSAIRAHIAYLRVAYDQHLAEHCC